MLENKTDTVKNREKAILIGRIGQDQTEEEVSEYLEELAFLTNTAGAIPVEEVTQKLNAPDPKTFLGKGKMNQIRSIIRKKKLDVAIFDDELTPSQLRNIEKVLDIKILDRNNLILDIFAKRARTAHAKTQVELAQYEYLLPRLTRMWTHLSRQKGGIGLRGPGETEIETDRRIIRDKISRLKKKLEKIDKQKATQRKNRGSLVRVALVGYTNTGKSTIMNMLSKSEIFAENKLFATLDTTVRKVVIKNMPFLLTDTVGFIRKLPHQLVESFKSTLDEVREADYLIHVVDVSHPNFEEHIETVNSTLSEIDSIDKPAMMVFNKIDKLEQRTREEDEENGKPGPEIVRLLKKSWMAKTKVPTIFISATEKRNIESFRETLYNKVKSIHVTRYPYHNFYY